MKKLLSVFCMAILAGGLIFTSCTKNYTITVNANNDAWGTVTGGGTYADQATATLTATPNSGYAFVQWQDGNTDNPRTITVTENATYVATFAEVPQNEAKITFNGTSWVAANALGVDYTSQGYITFSFFKTASSQDDVYCQGFLETTPGTYDFEGTGGDIMHYRDPNYTFVDNDNVLGQGAGVEYWGWNSLSNTFAEHITAVDLNALTISGDWSVEVGSVETYATTGDWGTTVPFTGVMTNAEWAWTGKAMADQKVKTNGPTRK